MSSALPLIGLLEDDASMRLLMTSYLEKSGFRVFACDTATTFLATFEREHPDCILLDLSLPDEDGLVVVRKIRYHSDLPLFIVSARHSEQDRLAGLELGADDYITKPFHPRELVARIHNRLQRQTRIRPNPDTPTGGGDSSLHFRGFTLDLGRRILTNRQGSRIELTRGEFNALATLVRAKGNVVSRDQLKDAVSRRLDPPNDHGVNAIICRLRRKLDPWNQEMPLIRTVSGFGYQLDAELPSVTE
ncbi:MAG: response regulator transcription factor [Magnetococcales bacterium]|nr:response regulator transcription factor [Magnetococcales bacterium]